MAHPELHRWIPVKLSNLDHILTAIELLIGLETVATVY
jgi:hypothetical protein